VSGGAVGLVEAVIDGVVSAVLAASGRVAGAGTLDSGADADVLVSLSGENIR
jgi:hypothetical protein